MYKPEELRGRVVWNVVEWMLVIFVVVYTFGVTTDGSCSFTE